MKAVYDKAAFFIYIQNGGREKMNRSRDEPGKPKAAIWNAFFVGKKRAFIADNL